MSARYPGSKVETKRFTARHYDTFMNIASFGRYSSFIEKAIKLMGIKPQDRIIDFGAGTGRNARLILKYLSSKGKLLGIDISEVMTSQFKKRCANFPNAKIMNARIDEPLSFKKEFDKAFISFVLHGFPQSAREIIIDNAFKALKDGGEFIILDWNEFDLKAAPFYQRVFFQLIECPYAFDFIERDWKKILKEKGFTDFEEYLISAKFIRLLKARKIGFQ